MAVLTAINLMSAKSYGEFEFWFASTKVVAIIVFILVAGAYATRGDVTIRIDLCEPDSAWRFCSSGSRRDFRRCRDDDLLALRG